MDYSEFEHSCKYCKNGVCIKIRREVFCKYHGVLPQDNICKKYMFDPLKVKIKRVRILDTTKFNEEDFSIE